MKSQKSFEKGDRGILYLIPTPIGNLEDMTIRGIRLLKEVDLIASEDTRNTQKLLNHFEIKTPQISFHEHNTKERIDQLIEKLLVGETVAQVSDAGMPSISDPGHELVVACIDADIPVVPLPGASAGLTALIASGIAPQRFYFYGFLKRKKKEQLNELEELNCRPETLILYESPHRLKEVLKNMVTVFGPDRKLVCCRELTKRYEEFIRGTTQEMVEWAENSEIRGEFCLIIEGNSEASLIAKPDTSWENLSVIEHVNLLMEEKEISSKEAIKLVAKVRESKKQEIYAIFHSI
ncbi:16S rRNA (cytidine1402-2'-O)-methyltransferase [Carnobacterium iners]|uniref:Ribosomal RNA small subunit methyltransferase I n=1 Tax=Carnobacterium iners TaxID=1073423 RepID=A0A1X7MT12_9LACT|nr:16S rRNA (cytidine(1402)-2'-O)-methyltransferase [Carnobacterium iners]SEL00702.1 16S rRNA (cytidine1402-2'-O)-methyltransferase [Carnobacterium iners]SMH27176.1 16S rRNA (cytidine1402-2'-O)-methyltransferase [Carnobacterium iners]